jgi:hypothetical protein
MTKKDYVLIAKVLKDSSELERIEPVVFKLVCKRFSKVLANENPRFDRGRFLTACGVEQ